VRFIDQDLHDSGERVVVPKHYAEMASWRVAAELVRRHPDQLVVIETHPGGGLYDCLSIYLRQTDEAGKPWIRPLIDLNRGPRGHITTRAGTGGDRLNWIDVLFAADLRRDVIRRVEDECEIESPTTTPETTKSSIGIRLIDEMLSFRVASRSPLTALNGVFDGSGGAAHRQGLFAKFPSIPVADYRGEVSRLDDTPAYRYWFVCSQENGKEPSPTIAVDTWNGRLWTKSESDVDLLSVYRDHGSQITALATSLLM